MTINRLLRSKVASLFKHGAAAGMLQGQVPPCINSSVRWNSSEASLEADSREEKGFKGHDMLAPFTAGWQSTELHPLIIERSEGSYVYDINGKKYLDALAGLWCTALGGNEPRLVAAATEQLNKLPFYHSFWNRTTKPSLDLAKEILDIFTARKMGKVFFTNSGSEANDSQVKLVWYYNNALGRPNKKKFIARAKSYHGSTLISASLSGLPALHQKFDLPVPFVLHTDCPHYWRFHLQGETEEEFATRLANNLENLILKEGPETIAAFIAEPVMGAGGVIPPPKTYFEKIQAVVKKYDILFIADEVITAFGRLGTMFGCDKYNIQPDLVSLAKALSSAYMPIGAILVSPEISEVIHSQSNKLGQFSHGFTYSGHPVSCAVALEALKIYKERNIVEKVQAISPKFQEGIRAFSDSPIIGEIRGIGLILGTEFTDNKSPTDLFPPEWGVGGIFGAECEKQGMLVRVAGDTIMMSPPFIMSPEEVDELIGKYGEALKRTEEKVAELNRSIFNKNPRIQSGSSLICFNSLKNPSKISPLYSFPPKSLLFPSPARNSHLCRAAAAIPADGEGILDKKEKPKFLGVELLTLKKIIPLGVMFFCILFNYTILRDTKDVLVVTAKGSSAEIIPFLKTWVNLPMAIGFMLLYTKLSNVLSKDALFYSVIFPFIAFFGAFGFILYPLSAQIHPTAFADKLLAALGPNFLGPVAILRIWSFCLFYVMAELWGSVVISVLFWGFANQITTVEEAKEFYPLFGLGANIALIFSGRTVKYFSNLRKNLGPGVDGWAVSLKGMMSIVVILGLVISGIYWGVNKFVLNDPSLPRSDRKKKKEKPKLGMKESLKVLISSRYVRDLATLVVAYGISINLVEVTWKSKLKAQFPSPNEYSSFMGDFSTATGIATFTMMLLGRVILRKFGWGVAAMITPTVLLLTGVGFFSLLLFGEPLTPLLANMGMTPLLAAVYVGALQNIFSKSAKYSLFDPCKEMAYIPLDEDMKVKGKAAIDVVCNPLGKSGGALIQQFMILTFGSLANSTPYLGGILLVIVLAWLGAAKSLDSQFSPLAKQELVKEKRLKEATKEPVIEVSLVEAKSEVKPTENGLLQESGSNESSSSNGSALKQKSVSEPESSSESPTPQAQ